MALPPTNNGSGFLSWSLPSSRSIQEPPPTTPASLEPETISTESAAPECITFETVHQSVNAILETGLPEPEQVDLLQNLAHRVFQNIGRSHHSLHLKILKWLFCVPSPDPKDVAAVILNAAREEGTIQGSARSMGVPSERGFPSWIEGKPIDPETPISVSVGGGQLYLGEFFQEKNSGFAREGGGRGIYVSIHHPDYPDDSKQHYQIPDIEHEYAIHSCLHSFDTPALIRGTVPAKYLMQPNKKNYEALLMPENCKYFTMTKEDVFSVRKMDESNRLKCTGYVMNPRAIDGLYVAEFQKDGQTFYDYEPTLWSHVRKDYTLDQMRRLQRYMKQVHHSPKFVKDHLNRNAGRELWEISY